MRKVAASQENEGCQEPALRSGREAPSSSGRRRRRASRRTRRSVSIAPPKAGRGTECARREFSVHPALAPPSTREVDAPQAQSVAGHTRMSRTAASTEHYAEDAALF